MFSCDYGLAPASIILLRATPLVPLLGTQLGRPLLGHSSAEITRGTYIHSLPRSEKKRSRRWGDLLTGLKRTQIVENKFGVAANSMSYLD